ncbi:calcium-translocating P-type ATPase [Podospora aff. communis PSN243]|uniref:Calcium-transporting ATPase n=1 Tax=Podospora aff. communis PSN243 TaxID=3040156 RepID=A0AAV9G5K9_9PEZI|nr:calcium-translocating P-type ATPase [Podospora aff. communis PSN243]
MGRTPTPPNSPSDTSISPLLSGSTLQSGNDVTFDSNPLSCTSTAGTSAAGREHPTWRNDGLLAVSASELADMVEKRDGEKFVRLGGLVGIAGLLKTDLDKGLTLEEPYTDEAPSRPLIPALLDIEAADSRALQANREQRFGTNTLPAPKIRSFFSLSLDALGDYLIILLLFCAALTFFKEFSVPGSASRFGDAILILGIVAVVVLLAAAIEWCMSKEFSALSKESDDRTVQAIRSGKLRDIELDRVLVGDVLHLEAGNVAPADGILISKKGCEPIKCDESSFTGESDLATKCTGEEDYRDRLAPIENDEKQSDPFIFSGSQVMEGSGTYLVTGVGVNSCYGKIRMRAQQPREKTPLTTSMDRLAEMIGKVALLLAILLFILGVVQPRGDESWVERLTSALSMSVTLGVVAIPEGLPLAVTLSLACAMRRLSKTHRLLVKDLRACEAMSNATILCTDKTGTLTTNKMEVSAGFIGLGTKIISLKPEHPQFASSISPRMKDLLVDSITLNCTAEKQERDGKVTLRGCQTESALLQFAAGLDPDLLKQVDKERMVRRFHFNSRNKYMASIVTLPNDCFRLYVKGAPEKVLVNCEWIVDDSTMAQPLTRGQRVKVDGMVEKLSSTPLRTLAVAYRDLPRWPDQDLLQGVETCDEQLRKLSRDLTLIGVCGIHDPLRPSVQDTISIIKNAGIAVTMVTGDSVKTAKEIARNCGIVNCGIVTDDNNLKDVIMEAQEFDELDESEKNRVLPRLRVLARSTPEHKEKLVRRYKASGETVAVTGDGTNDGPALKAADVGFSMGSGTDVAKEASSIVLLDDDFGSIVFVVLYARACYDSIKKFIRFQLSTTLTAIVLTVLSKFLDKTLPGIRIGVGQWLWVNIIMDPLGALANAMDEPDRRVMERQPQRRKTLLSSLLREEAPMIIGQAVLQVAVVLGLGRYGEQIVQYTRPTWISVERHGVGAIKTLVFNSLVWAVFFNLINNRCLDDSLNPFKGLHRSQYFLSVLAIIAVVGAALVQLGMGKMQPLNATGWAISIALGFLSIPTGLLIRLITRTTPSPAAKFIDLHLPGRIVTPAANRRQNGDTVPVVRQSAMWDHESTPWLRAWPAEGYRYAG